jgi:hypothetical protein
MAAGRDEQMTSVPVLHARGYVIARPLWVRISAHALCYILREHWAAAVGTLNMTWAILLRMALHAWLSNATVVGEVGALGQCTLRFSENILPICEQTSVGCSVGWLR